MDLSIDSCILQPLPGEIWAVTDDANFDSPAGTLRVGAASPLAIQEITLRYLLIIREVIEPAADSISVMVLSAETDYRNDTNILIPPEISGLEIATIAQTWNVGEIDISYLDRRVGNRLSRPIYDLLLTIANPHRDRSIDIRSYRSSGLSDPPHLAFQNHTALEKFTLHERAWLLHLQPAKLEAISKLVATAIEREPIVLSQWFSHIFPQQWQELKTVKPDRAIATRRSTNNISITEIIDRLQSSENDNNRHLLIDRIRSIEAIPADLQAEIESALVAIIDRTDDDNLFWSAIACLRSIVPSHQRVDIVRFKQIESIDNIHLILHLAHKQDNHISIFLQVKPQPDREYLPSDLKLRVSDNNERVLQEIVARSRDYCLQLKFSGEIGERFNICLELDNIRSIDRFVI